MRVQTITNDACYVEFSSYQVLFARGEPIAYRNLSARSCFVVDRELTERERNALSAFAQATRTKPQAFFDGLRSLTSLD